MVSVFRSRRVVLPRGVGPADIVVEDEVVADVRPHGSSTGAVRELGELVVMPGLVDSHVHVNEPGRTEWEGFETASRAAAAGGVTTLVDMPLNSLPPTVGPDELRMKREAAKRSSWVDVAFWGGIVPGTLERVSDLVESGVCGFKVFLVESGVPEYPPVAGDELIAAAAAVTRHAVPLLVHAEEPEELKGPEAAFRASALERRRDPLAYAASRPALAEDVAVQRLVDLSRSCGAHIHVLHLASGTALPIIERAQQEGVSVSAETCPHYLTLTAEEIPAGDTRFKCAPPIRTREHREMLWSGLAQGTISLVVSDHSPAPESLKALDSGDFASAWGGIASLQLRLPLMWTEARSRGFGFVDLARWLAEGPADLAGLDVPKGSIAPGKDADLVIWDPEACWKVDPEGLEHRHPVTPYAGRVLQGRVVTTVLRGEAVFEFGEFVDRRGRLLSREG